MPDFTAKPIPEGLLQSYIQAKSQTPMSTGLEGLSSGLTKGLQLTEAMSKIKKQREVEDLTNQVMSTPEFQEADKEFKGLLSIGVKADPVKGLSEFVDFTKKKTEDDYNKIKTEMEAIQKEGDKGGFSTEMQDRIATLGQAIPTKKYPVEGAYEWAKTTKEPYSVKLKRRAIEFAEKQDPVMKDLRDQVNVAKGKFDGSGEDVDKENYESAVMSYQTYWNNKYKDNPNMQITNFEEARKALVTLPVVGTITKKAVVEKGKSLVGQIVEKGGKKWKVKTLKEDGTPNDVVEVK